MKGSSAPLCHRPSSGLCRPRLDLINRVSEHRMRDVLLFGGVDCSRALMCASAIDSLVVLCLMCACQIPLGADPTVFSIHHSSPPRPMSQSDQKRGRDHETTGNAAPSQTDDRSVRQRIEPASAAAVSSGRSFASSSLPSRLSLLGLAVVERQLILQSLDWESLVHVASTCRQLRVESFHK